MEGYDVTELIGKTKELNLENRQNQKQTQPVQSMDTITTVHCCHCWTQLILDTVSTSRRSHSDVFLLLPHFFALCL
jgi:hypothetical protein